MARELPWSTWEEWNLVKDLLYSLDDVSKQQEGIQFVDMWRSRIRSGCLPVSVDLTATLVAASIQLNQYHKGNVHQAQLSSAMALVRFVNGITDQFQTGLYAQSVQLIAEKIDIPDWMVDLRHEITHAQLPSIDIISSGVMVALNWLHQNYWNKTGKNILDQEHFYYTNFMEILEKYKNSVHATLFEEKTTDQKSNKQQAKDREIITQTLMKQTNQNNGLLLIETLTRHELLMIKDCFSKLGLTFPVANETLTESSISFLNHLASIWQPLFLACQEKFESFFEDLYASIIKRYHSKENTLLLIILFLFSLVRVDRALHLPIVRFLLQHQPSNLGFQVVRSILGQGTLGEDEKKQIEELLLIFESAASILSKPCTLNENWRHFLADKPMVGKYAKLIEDFSEDFDEELLTNEVVHNSKWRQLSRTETMGLPAIGELPSTSSFHDFNLKKRIVRVLDISFDVDLLNAKHREEKQYFDKTLVSGIDNLFTYKNTVFIEESDNDSCLTNEYAEDDMEWGDENDIDLKVAPTNMVNSYKLDVSSLDVSKMMFF